MEDLLHLIYLIFGAIIIAICYSLLPVMNNPAPQLDATQNYFCGTTSFSIPTHIEISETISPEIGKKLFKNNCAQCHLKNMVSDGTGPALYDSMKRWKHDTLKYRKYIRNSENYMKEFLDERMINLKKKFDFKGNSHVYDFSEDEITSLLIYIDAISYR